MSKEIEYETTFCRNEETHPFEASKDNVRLCRDNEENKPEGVVSNYSARLEFITEGDRVPTANLSVKYLLINHTVTDSVKEAVEIFQKYGSSCHIIIDQDGSREMIVDPVFRAYFAGAAFVSAGSARNSSGELEKDLNSTSISVMMVNDGKSSFSMPQIESFAAVAANLTKKYEIDPNNILGLGSVAVKHCGINPHFPWKSLANEHNLGVYPKGQYDLTDSAPIISALADEADTPTDAQYQAVLSDAQQTLEAIGFYIPAEEKSSEDKPASFGIYSKAALRAFKTHYESETVVSHLGDEAGEVVNYTGWWQEMSPWMHEVRAGDLACMHEVADLLGVTLENETLESIA